MLTSEGDAFLCFPLSHRPGSVYLHRQGRCRGDRQNLGRSSEPGSGKPLKVTQSEAKRGCILLHRTHKSQAGVIHLSSPLLISALKKSTCSKNHLATKQSVRPANCKVTTQPNLYHIVFCVYIEKLHSAMNHYNIDDLPQRSSISLAQ